MRRITCREIIIFIVKFQLWAAEFSSSLTGITFIKYDDNREAEDIYTIHENGDYVVKFWNENGNKSDWKIIEEGNIYKWEEVK